MRRRPCSSADCWGEVMNGLFGEVQDPGLLAAEPQPQQQGGVGALLARLFAGASDPRLSDDQNKKARDEGIIHAILGGIISAGYGQRPGILPALAHGAFTGRTGGGMAREQAYADTQEERLRQALSDPTVVGKLTPEQLAMIRLLPPPEAVKMLTELAFAPAPAPLTVAEDAAVIDPTTREVLYKNEGKVKLPSELIAAARLSGIDPEEDMTPEEQKELLDTYMRIKQSGAASTRVDVNIPELYEKGLTQIELKQYEDSETKAYEAENTLGQIEILEMLLDSGLDTGAVQSATLAARNLGAALGIPGIDLGKLAGQQLFSAVASRFALSMRKEMPGPLSENDVKFLVNMSPNLSNTPEGNRLIAAALRRMAQRQIELHSLQNEYLQEHGSLRGWFDKRRKFQQENPMFEDLSREAYRITGNRQFLPDGPWKGSQK